MGQRLNLEIHDDANGGLQANAYFHWSGYSVAALDQAKQAVSALRVIGDEKPVRRAVEALEATGAGLTDEEREKCGELLGDYEPQPCSDRNDGLLAISAGGMEETRRWEEERIEIHLNAPEGDYLRYSVYWAESPEEYKEGYEEDPSQLPATDLDFEHLPFDKIDELEQLVEQHDAVRVGDSVYVFIK
jgi:hypothetical protein